MALWVGLKRRTGHFKTDMGGPFYSGKMSAKAIDISMTYEAYLSLNYFPFVTGLKR